MITVNVKHAADFEGWRSQARALLNAEVDPALVLWQVAGVYSDLFATGDEIEKPSEIVSSVNDQRQKSKYYVPRSFLAMAEEVVCHSDDRRFALLSVRPVLERTFPMVRSRSDSGVLVFSNIFNPAHLRLDAMWAEMPVKYWKNLPEAPIIARLTREAGSRTSSMVAAAPTREPRFAQSALYRVQTPVPSLSSISQLRDSARNCDKCAHACDATQSVFGHGPETARVMIVGEQPGDIEDVRGKPFVGPSGKLLRTVLAELSVDEDEIHFTNAVKHFKYTVRGKRRLHLKPSAGDINHCRSWLVEEIVLVKPSVIVAYGSTATRSLLGRSVRLEEERGSLQGFGESVSLMMTHHPARILRASNQGDRKKLREQLLEDLSLALAQFETA